MRRHKLQRIGVVLSALLLVAFSMVQPVFAANQSYSFENGFPSGWKKLKDEFVMETDKKEKALKIEASSGSKLEFEPTETFPIGENKNRFMVLRIKGDPDMTRVVVYFTLMSQGEDHPYGSTVRLIENQKIGEDMYTDIVFDLYTKGKGYGNDWKGELRRLRLDLNNAQGLDPSGTLYLQSIIFYDMESEIAGGADVPPVTVAPTKPAPTTAAPTKPTEPPETESNPVENSSAVIQTTKKAADTKTTSVKKTEKPVISDGDGSGPNVLLIVLVSLAVVIAAAGIVSAFLLAKKMNLFKQGSTGPSDGPGASK